MRKIKLKSGIDASNFDSGTHSGSPLEDIIIHLCIKDAVTCRAVIEVTRLSLVRLQLPHNVSGAHRRQGADQRIALPALPQE